MSNEVAAAFNVIRKTRAVKATLTGLGTQIEARDIDSARRAVMAAHMAVRKKWSARIISSVRIDERLDRSQSLEDEVRSVKKELSSE